MNTPYQKTIRLFLLHPTPSGNWRCRPSGSLRQELLPPNRTIFASETRDRLVQLQQDRFVTNWRGEGSTYPRFDQLLESFFERWSGFLSFVRDEQLGTVAPTRIDVSYVNHVSFESLAEFLNLAGNLNISVPELDGVPSDTQLNLRYDSSAGGIAGGALFVSVNRPLKGPLIPPGQPTTGWFFNLNFRGPVADPGDPMAIRQLLIHGREVIDHAFVDLTKADVQRNVWRKV